MSKWFLRGLVFAALMVVIRLIQGVLINAFESKAGLISLALVILFVIPVMMWGHSDGRADAAANPDPDRRDDLAMTWLGAGLVAGLLSGLVCWIVALVDKALYASTFFNELTSFAAFTALLVFVPAVAAVSLGRRHIDKNYAKMPQRHHGLAAEGQPQPATDVFATVGAAPLAAGQTAEGQTAEAHTDVFPVQTGPTQTDAAQTDAAAPADTDATLGGPAAGFTTEAAPVDPDATTEFPKVTDDNPEQQG